MKVRLPYIDAAKVNTAWTPYTAADEAATIYSMRKVMPVVPKAVIKLTGGGPFNAVINIYDGATTDTFDYSSSPKTATEIVQDLLASAHVSYAELGADIGYEEITVFGSGAGSASTITLTSGAFAEIKAIESGADDILGPSAYTVGPATVTGHDGAYWVTRDELWAASNYALTIEVDGTPQTITILAASPFAATDDADDVATAIDALLTSASCTNTAGRLKIVHDTAGENGFLEIVTDDKLFAEETVSRGRSTSLPSSDEADSRDIRLLHPADPVYFRNINRVFIDLAANDRDMAAEFIKFRDGYDFRDGTVAATTLSGTYNFLGSSTFSGDITVLGKIKLSTISVAAADTPHITLNNDDTAFPWGDGYSTNLGGLVIKLGGADGDALLTYNPEFAGVAAEWSKGAVGKWSLTANVQTPAVVVTGQLLVEKGIHEAGQITIGDGTTTFGTYNAAAGDIFAALTAATAALASGGKIFVKRGTYTLSNSITLPDNTLLCGEGASTIIDAASLERIILGQNSTVKDITFVNCDDVSGFLNIQFDSIIVTCCRFSGAGKDVLIGGTGADATFIGNISTTTTSGLP